MNKAVACSDYYHKYYTTMPYRIVIPCLLSTVLLACTPPQPNQHLSYHYPKPHEQGRNEAADQSKQGNYEAAISSLKELLQLSPSDAETRYQLAENLRMAGRSDEALIQYNRVLEDSDLPRLSILEGMGLAYMQIGNFDKAIALFTEIISQDATKWQTINALGTSLALDNRLEEALEYFDMALGLSDDNPSILNNVGLAFVLSGDTTQGIDLLEQARRFAELKDHPKTKLTVFNLALAYGVAGDMEQAEQLLTPYLNKAQIYNNLGYYANLRNNPDLAKTYLSKAMSSSPVHYEKAWHNKKLVRKGSAMRFGSDETSHQEEIRTVVPVLRPN